jgi:hypothetical protein
MSKPKFNIGDRISGKVVTIFAAVTNTELNDGRGDQYDKSYHLTRGDAVIGASGIGVMGSDGDVEPRTALQISEEEYIILPEQSVRVVSSVKNAAELRKSGLSKLTKAEKAALQLG